MEENQAEDQVCLIYSQYNGIVFDLKYILKSRLEGVGINVFPDDDFNLNIASSESRIKKSIEKFQFNYEKNVENAIKTSRLVIFIVTNDSVKSDKCVKLLQLSRELNNISIVSLIVEEIQNLDEIKSTLLSGIDHHFEVYKDRVHVTGYDQYMLLGEHFQNFVTYIKCVLNIQISKFEKKTSRDYYFSFSFSNKTTPNKIGKIIKTLNGYNYLPFDLQIKHRSSENTQETIKNEYIGFDYYDFVLKSKHIDKDIEYYASNIRIFDDIVKNNIIAEEIKEVKFNAGDFKYGYIYTHIKQLVGYCEMKEETTSFLREELKKHDINIDFLNDILGLLYNNDYYYESITSDEFLINKTIIFFMTEEYYKSKKFQKLYYEAKRMEKIIFLVKLDDFDLKIDDGFEEIHVHDVSKHADCNYEGYLTRILLCDLNKCCKLSKKTLKYNIWYEIFINCDHSCNIESIQMIKKLFEEKKMRIKCKFDYNESKDEINEIRDDMEKSNIVIFCLTNDYYLKSDEFQLNFSYFKKPNNRQDRLPEMNKKPVLFLLMEEVNSTDLIDLQSFNVIEFYKLDSFKGEIFYRLCYFIYSLLYSKQTRVSYEDDEKVQLQAIDSEYNSQKYSLFKDNQLFKRGKLMKVIEKEKYNYDHLVDVAYIKHLNIYCFVYTHMCNFYDANFNYTHQYIHPQPEIEETQEQMDYYHYLFVEYLIDMYELKNNSVFYDEKNKNIYLEYSFNDLLHIEKLDDQMRSLKKLSMKPNCDYPGFLINNNQILMIDTNVLLVFNLDLEIICEIEYPKLGSYRMLDVEPKFTNYVYIRNDNANDTVALNINGLNFNENMISKQDYSAFRYSIFSNNLSFKSIGLYKIEIFEIEYNKCYDNAISPALRDYICKLNSYPPHLLKNPYVLPCGSFACLEFEDKHENIENIFKFIEEDIEIRFESVKIKIDEHKEAQIKFIERLEKMLLKASSKASNKIMKITNSNDDIKNKDIIIYLYSKCLLKFDENDKKKIIGVLETSNGGMVF